MTDECEERLYKKVAAIVAAQIEEKFREAIRLRRNLWIGKPIWLDGDIHQQFAFFDGPLPHPDLGAGAHYDIVGAIERGEIDPENLP